MNTINKTFALLILVLSWNTLSAQPDLPSEEVEIIKDFEAALEESNRLTVKPELPPTDSTTRSLMYTIPSKTITVEYLPPKIRPIAMRRDQVPDTYKGFAKLGYGIPSSPYAELSYHTGDPERYEIGFNGLHHSANFKDVENQRFSFTDLGLDGTYYNEEGFAVKGDIGFKMDQIHFYGYDDEEQTYERDRVRQQFNTFTLGGQFFNGERTVGDINYHAGFDFYALNDNYASGETNLDIDLGLTKWFQDQHELSVNIITDFTTFEDTSKQKINNFYFMPHFTFHGDAFKIKVGANLTSNDDIFKVFPNVEAAVNVLGNKLMAFAGADGNLYKNSFKALTDYNPFLVSRTEIRNSSYYDFYGGIRGNLSVIDYKVQAGFKRVDDLATFLTDFSDTLRFNVFYDTTDIVYIKGTINSSPVEGLELIGTVGINNYSPNNFEKAWHLPALEVTASIIYTTLEDKLRLKGDLFVENGVPFINDAGEADNLNGLFDLSLGAEYQATQNIGIFFQLNNLANNKRQRWANYPTYGINILGGVTARF
jgi:hypothetical protein